MQGIDMSNVQRVERQIGGQILSIETGKIARQAHGAVVVQYGETVVLVTAVTSAPRFDDIDFFPLSVDYREKTSAAGKFPGGFIKREGRPSTKETLTARTIDRPIRPLFPEGYFQEVQIIANVMSFDGEHDPDVIAMIGASAALSISKIPFLGPIGACRFAKVEGEFVIFPTHEQLADCELNLLLGGRKEAINMIEIEAKEQSEQVVADAVAKAHKVVGEVCDMIAELQEKVGVEKEIKLVENDEEIQKQIEDKYFCKFCEIKLLADKTQRKEQFNQAKDEVFAEFCEQGNDENKTVYSKGMVKRMVHDLEGKAVKKMLLDGKRADGRNFEQVREITCEADVLPRTHGSALFTRGETQALVTVTLGTIRDAQIIDGLTDEYSQNFTLHYNFPPFSVGEVRPMRGVGRREIGHGALAEKSLEQVRPDEAEFAYTIRIVSDITESNGSSSMASVCGGTLALMDAGVPIKRPVAGISVGLISDDNGYNLLTDIVGEEDHFGEMDFKVAGTTEGITGIQLDIKAEGLEQGIMVEALEKARVARLQILETMAQALSTPRETLSQHAPKLTSIQINPELIGKLIGPGGKVIKALQEQTETTIEIEDDGTVHISCLGGDNHLKARDIIESMTTHPKVGKIYEQCKVVSVRDFGAFVEFVPGTDGLCHVSELSDAYVKNVEDVVKVGDLVDVKLILIDDQGRYKLSRKAALKDKGISEREEKTEAPAKKE